MGASPPRLVAISPRPPGPQPADRVRLIRRARLLAYGGNAWHVVEFVVALAAGIAASSIALVAFGLDSLIEFAAGSVIVWLLASHRHDSEIAERRAQRLIAASYFALAAYIVVDAAYGVAVGDHPKPSTLGIALAAVAAVTMPALAIAKRRVGHALGSAATAHEGTQNMLCAYLSVALLVGLGANAVFGWWWADPLAGIAIAAVAVKEGREGWRGEACGCHTPITTTADKTCTTSDCGCD
jgi:divalent metal cation (Fe/Co/Zn/Cd) transporter